MLSSLLLGLNVYVMSNIILEQTGHIYLGCFCQCFPLSLLPDLNSSVSCRFPLPVIV